MGDLRHKGSVLFTRIAGRSQALSEDFLQGESMNIGKYQFNGPFPTTDQIQNRSGVYAVLDCHSTKSVVVDVGESGFLRSRLQNHDRKDCWRRNCTGQLKVAVLYVNEFYRMRIEEELRSSFKPTCGKR